jgi:hypothetical protein
MNRKPLTRETIAAAAWGAGYLRELDLMVAANELASRTSGNPLYNDPFDLACARRLAPLDGDLTIERLPDVVVPIADDAQDQHRRTDEIVQATLQGRPRGHYAVFRLADRFHAYISNGAGGIEAADGRTFDSASASAPRFDHDALYVRLISMMIYLRRNQIGSAIIAHSITAAGLLSGRTVTDATVGGKVWSRVVFDKTMSGYYSGGGDAYRVVCHRRGVKPLAMILDSRNLQDLFGVPAVMPAVYDDPGNADRVLDIVKPVPSDVALSVARHGRPDLHLR